MKDITYPFPGEQLEQAYWPALSQEHIQQVVKEAEAFAQLSVSDIEHLYLMPLECYLVTFKDSHQTVFVRNDQEQLRPASGWTYHDYNNFADTHETRKEETTTEPSEEPVS